jgi:hypothetical protein
LWTPIAEMSVPSRLAKCPSATLPVHPAIPLLGQAAIEPCQARSPSPLNPRRVSRLCLLWTVPIRKQPWSRRVPVSVSAGRSTYVAHATIISWLPYSRPQSPYSGSSKNCPRPPYDYLRARFRNRCRGFCFPLVASQFHSPFNPTTAVVAPRAAPSAESTFCQKLM